MAEVITSSAMGSRNWQLICIHKLMAAERYRATPDVFNSRLQDQQLWGGMQWSNCGGARGGLAHLKDLAAAAKHLF